MPINSPDVFNPVGDATVSGGGGGGGDVEIQEEGVALTSAVTSINFTGKGSTASNSGTDVTVNSPARVVTVNFSFFDNSVRNVYIPFNSEAESTNLQRYNKLIQPSNGTLKTIFLQSSDDQTGGTGTLKIDFLKVTGATTTATLESVTVTALAGNTTTQFDFTSNSFNAGDNTALFLTGNGASIMSNTFGTAIFELNA